MSGFKTRKFWANLETTMREKREEEKRSGENCQLLISYTKPMVAFTPNLAIWEKTFSLPIYLNGVFRLL